MDIQTLMYLNLFNQSLIEKNGKNEVVRNLCGLQAQFMSNAYHALKIRCNERINVDGWGEGFVKTWANRGTVHVITIDDIGLYRTEEDMSKCSIWESNWKISAERKKFFSDLIVRLIRDEGIVAREELKVRCFDYGMSSIECEAVFDQWGGVIRELAEKGKLCYKVAEKKEFMICPCFTPIKEYDAKLEKTYRYFKFYGPATVKDAAYFFSATQREIKDLIKSLPCTKYNINNKEYFYIGDEPSFKYNIPKCVFLAGFDPLMLGYQKKESIYLPMQYMRGIFNLAGIVMPAVLYDGQVIGKWKKTSNKLVITYFKDIPSHEKKVIEEEANKLWGENLKFNSIMV